MTVEDDDFEEGPLPEVRNECRCGDCCRRLILEASLEDAEREPKIAARGRPLLSSLGDPENLPVAAYSLNNRDGGNRHCIFLDEPTNLCTIYNTRPDMCR